MFWNPGPRMPEHEPDKEHLPPAVRRFLLAKIASIPHLEALLLLREDPDAWWTAEHITRRLYIVPGPAVQILQDLAAAGLAQASNEAPTGWRYGPESRALGDAVEETAAFYARNIRVVANLVHAMPKTAAEKFAEAFRLRRNPDE